MTRNSPATPFLLGVIATLGFTIVTQNTGLTPAYADGGGGDGGIFMVTNNGSSAQGRDILFLVESNEDRKRLAIYEYAGGRLELGAVRDIGYDLEFQSWAKNKGAAQKPSIKVQKEAVEEMEKERRKKKKKNSDRP